MKNSSDTIGNRTRDLLTCSAVPQPTAPPRSPIPKSRGSKKTCIVRDLSFTTSLIEAALSNTKPLSARKSHGSYSDQNNVKTQALYIADKQYKTW